MSAVNPPLEATCSCGEALYRNSDGYWLGKPGSSPFIRQFDPTWRHAATGTLACAEPMPPEFEEGS